MPRSYTPLALTLVAAALAATACSSNEGRRQQIAYVERPVEQLYNAAAAELEKRDFMSAIAMFNEVERQHPYSEWARRAMVMTAFANYQARDYDEAVSSAQRYLALHPGGSEASYAYYLIAMCEFERILDIGRDQAKTEQAKAALDNVVRRFPDSEYARDAQLKIDMVNDQLAGKEMEVGRWYLRSNQTLSAINRFRTVVTKYNTTSHTPEALHRLVEAYLTIGLYQEALVAGSTLGYNYPETDWYQMSYRLLSDEGIELDDVSEAEKRTFWQRLIPGGK